MPRSTLRRIVAKRSFQLAGLAGERERPVTLEFGEPQRDSPNGSFKCFFQISGILGLGMRYGAGSDAVQAQLLAMVNAATLLYTSQEWKDGRLTLNGSKNLDLPAVASTFAESVPEQVLQLVV